MGNRPTRTILRPIVLTLVALAVAAGGLALGAPRLRAALRGVTGEESLGEQLKGAAALAYLRLTVPAPRTDPYVPIAHTGLPPYGVNTFLEQEVEPEKVDRTLAMAAQAGFRWIRQEFPWEDIEISAKGDFRDHKWDVDAWAKYDAIVEAAERHGLEIIARLDNPPAWSRARGDEPGWEVAPPDDYRDFGDFVHAVVSRYRGRVRYYQIWNEPNIFPEWGAQDADPAAYVELLRIAYTRAKEADPDCVILSAGLAQTLEMGPRNLSDLVYLERMYEAGAAEWFDVLGAQVYGLWTGPQDRRTSPDRTNFARAELLREIMVRHGDAHKPIWATEVGWNATPPELGQFPYGRTTVDQQAEYAVAAYHRAEREWPWMGVMNYWFLRRPSDAERGQPWYYFRLLEPDFTPLPVYHALAELAAEPPVMGLGYHQEDHWALRYEGAWRTVEDPGAVLGAYAEGDEGDAVAFDFHGGGLAVALRDGAGTPSLRLEIDGRPAELLPLPEGTHVGDAVFAAGRLRPGPHSARLSVTGGTAGLDGVIVLAGDGAFGLAWWGGGAAVLAAVALVVGLRRAARRRRG